MNRTGRKEEETFDMAVRSYERKGEGRARKVKRCIEGDRATRQGRVEQEEEAFIDKGLNFGEIEL